jgi:hypothetical protein
MRSPRHIISIIFLLTVFGGVGLYALFALRNAYTGPRITVNPLSHDPNSSDIEITGTVERAVDFSINGYKVPLTTQGNFSEHEVLVPGDNVYILHATDRFGTAHEETLRIWHELNAADPTTTAPEPAL